MLRRGRPVVYRHSVITRVTHWVWALSLFFLAGTGLNIFMAHPVLYLGEQSGFEFNNAVLAVGAVRSDSLEGVVEVFGKQFVTTGVFGVSDGMPRAVPEWASIPSYPDLATARVIHFFFAWLLVAVWLIWFIGSLVNGHFRRDIFPRWRHVRAVPKQIRRYVRLDIVAVTPYSALQRVSYASLMLGALPLMVLTGLAMSPAAYAIFPPLEWMFGGRETARTLHFVGLLALVLFFFVHVAMVLITEPINGMRGMITGWAHPTKKQQESANEKT